MLRRVAETLYYQGLVYMDVENYPLALSKHQDALAIYARQQSTYDIPSMYAIIGKTHDEAGNEKQAVFYYNQAIALAKEIESPRDLLSVYEDLAERYEKIMTMRRPTNIKDCSREISDTIYTRETQERMEQLETTYKLKMQLTENAMLKAEKARHKAELSQRTTMATGASLIALLIAVIAFIYYRAHKENVILAQNLEKEVAARTADLQRSNAKLLNSNEELERFTYIASHDLKEPLRNITSFVNLIQRKTEEFSRSGSA